jgi:hypothetical protein
MLRSLTGGSRRAVDVQDSSPALIHDAITTRSLCCDCLERITGLSAIAVRRWLLTTSRTVRLDTWTPCQSCGALDETYRIARVGVDQR